MNVDLTALVFRIEAALSAYFLFGTQGIGIVLAVFAIISFFSLLLSRQKN